MAHPGSSVRSYLHTWHPTSGPELVLGSIIPRRECHLLMLECGAVSVHRFFSKYISEDNASFDEIREADARRLRHKKPWLFREGNADREAGLAEQQAQLTGGGAEGGAPLLLLEGPGAESGEGVVATKKGPEVCALAGKLAFSASWRLLAAAKWVPYAFNAFWW